VDKAPQTTGGGAWPRGRPKTAQAVTVALLVVTLAIAVFVIQNTDDADITFLAWTVQLPLAGALLLAVALGGIFAYLVAWMRYRQFRHALRDERRRQAPAASSAPSPPAGDAG
jgi:uncharacterized integral membrane protein